MTKAEINEHVRTMAGLSRGRRQAYLQALIGPPVRNLSEASARAELQSRALLVTRLNDAGIWPPRG